MQGMLQPNNWVLKNSSGLTINVDAHALPSGIYFMNAVPILLQAENFFIVSGVAILLSVAAAVLPSSVAGRLDPLVTLRFR